MTGIRKKFRLPEADRHIFEAIHRHFPPQWADLCRDTRLQASHGEWLGVFMEEYDVLPKLMFQASESCCPELLRDSQLEIPETTPTFQLGMLSHTLVPFVNSTPRQPSIEGTVRRICVVITNTK